MKFVNFRYKVGETEGGVGQLEGSVLPLKGQNGGRNLSGKRAKPNCGKNGDSPRRAFVAGR
jgi:hypothetical protein